MQHIGPRIYRSLEKRTERDGFDTIVLAALAGYTALREPSERHVQDLARLIVPFWEKIGPLTRHTLAESLAASRLVPAALAEKLAEVRLDTSAPQHEASNSPADTFDTPTAMPATDRSPATRLTNADTVRETLRRLVQPGRIEPPTSARPGASAKSVADLIALARSQDNDETCAALAGWLRLRADHASEMTADATGEALATALKAGDIAEADALTLILLLKPAVAGDLTAFAAIRTHYRALSVDACRAALDLPSIMPQLDIARSRRSADADGSIRAEEPAERRAFGRRMAPPADRLSGRRGG